MRTKYCSRCGSIIEDGAEFCGECGARVTDATDVSSYGFSSASEDGTAPSPKTEETSEPFGQHPQGVESSFEGEPTSSTPPQNGAYSQPQNGGYAQSGYNGQQQNGGYAQGGYNGQQQNGGYAQGGYNGQQQNGGYAQGGYNGQQQNGGYAQGGYNGQQQNGGYTQGANYGAPQNNGYINGGGFQQMNGPGTPIPPNSPSGSQKIPALILGIVSIVFALLLPIITYVCGGIGLVFASKAKQNGENATAAQICCIIGLVLAVINSIMGIILALSNYMY